MHRFAKRSINPPFPRTNLVTMRPLLFTALVMITPLLQGAGPEDPLAPWRQNVTIKPVVPDAQRHIIHSYFNTCPESPDGSKVLFFSSTTKEAHHGNVC